MRGMLSANKGATMYLAWFDDHPKRDVRYKITEAIFAYEDRFGERPNVVLVNADQQLDEQVEGVEIVVSSYIRKHNFWVGIEQIPRA